MATNKKPSDLKDRDSQSGCIYNHSIDNIQEIISVAESGLTQDWFEVYITKY